MTDIFGIYNIRSRICVGLVVLAPLLFQAYMLVPEVRNISSTFVITLITFALSNLIIIVARIRGSKALRKCFPDILPAQQFLLPEDTSIDEITKTRYYDFFRSHLGSFEMTNDTKNSKIQSESAIKWLIARTRNSSDFPLIAEENTNLGFSYNLLGMKPFGLTICLILIVFNIVMLFLSPCSYITVDITTLIFCLSFTILYLMMWVCIINQDLVKNCAKKYARTLLSACDSELLNNSQS
jgi:hypothetical protein